MKSIRCSNKNDAITFREGYFNHQPVLYLNTMMILSKKVLKINEPDKHS